MTLVRSCVARALTQMAILNITTCTLWLAFSHRCISMLRQRTLDVVEAVAAWHRRVGNPEPFVYYGNDYLANIGGLSET